MGMKKDDVDEFLDALRDGIDRGQIAAIRAEEADIHFVATEKLP